MDNCCNNSNCNDDDDDDDFVSNPVSLTSNKTVLTSHKQSVSCICNICGKNISSFNETRRLQHLNR